MKNLFTTLLLAAATAVSASAADFFSNEPAEELITFGARIGFNTSNASTTGKYFEDYNENSWGLGFDAGVVCNINFRDYFSLQPGVFYQSRTHKFSYISNYGSSGKDIFFGQFGHYRSYNINVPIMAAFHFNLSDNIRWNVEAGPYFNINAGSKRSFRAQLVNEPIHNPILFDSKPSPFEVGLKLGTSITVFDHYSIGVHYMAGLTDCWKNLEPFEGTIYKVSGHSKAWTFTLGYDF